MKIFVTGASGQLGRRLIRELIKHGHTITAHYRSEEKARKYCPDGVKPAYGDLCRGDWLTEAIRGSDYVIHGAARVSVRPLNKDQTDYMYQVNVEGTRKVVEACRQAGVKRLLHISSVAAVGASTNTQPVDETAVFNLGGYGIPYFETKHKAEKIALAANSDKLEVISLAPSIMISPPDRPVTEKDLRKIPRWLPVYFDFGLNLVETGDVIEAIIAALDKGTPGQRYLLTGDNIDPVTLFAIAKKYLGIKRPLLKIPIWGLYAIGAIAELIYLFKKKKPRLNRSIARLAKLRFIYTNDKARRDLGFAPKPLEETVRGIIGNIKL